jgi:hypothetical protein
LRDLLQIGRAAGTVDDVLLKVCSLVLFALFLILTSTVSTGRLAIKLDDAQRQVVDSTGPHLEADNVFWGNQDNTRAKVDDDNVVWGNLSIDRSSCGIGETRRDS